VLKCRCFAIRPTAKCRPVSTLASRLPQQEQPQPQPKTPSVPARRGYKVVVRQTPRNDDQREATTKKKVKTTPGRGAALFPVPAERRRHERRRTMPNDNERPWLLPPSKARHNFSLFGGREEKDLVRALFVHPEQNGATFTNCLRLHLRSIYHVHAEINRLHVKVLASSYIKCMRIIKECCYTRIRKETGTDNLLPFPNFRENTHTFTHFTYHMAHGTPSFRSLSQQFAHSAQIFLRRHRRHFQLTAVAIVVAPPSGSIRSPRTLLQFPLGEVTECPTRADEEHLAHALCAERVECRRPTYGKRYLLYKMGLEFFRFGDLLITAGH
jgi:hypothetical protein